MKLVCMGSFNRDIVYTVEHIAAAGETILSKSRSTYWGGKGLNQALAAARGGADTAMCGMVNKADHAEVLALLQENGLNGGLVAACGEPTGHAIISVDRAGQNSITVFGGSNACLTNAYVDEALAPFAAGDILLLQNEVNNLAYIIRAARARGMRVALNPSPFQSELMELPLAELSYLVLNETEGFQMTGEREPDAILAALRKHLPETAVVLTLGGDGALFADANGCYAHGVYDVPVVDTTAAGDTFTGFFLAASARGEGAKEALTLASKAASLAVSRKGATSSIPALAEVLAWQAQPVERAAAR